MVEKEHVLQINRITACSSKDRSVLERVQTIANIIRTIKVQDMVWDRMGATMLTLRAIVYATTKFTPIQLVFGLETIANTKNKVVLKIIKHYKQWLINCGNK